MTTRIAVESDWPRICELMREHAINAEVPLELAVPPSLNEAHWLVADDHGRVTCALALMRGGQICLLWNPGRAETLGAALLMQRAYKAADIGRCGLWFATIENAKPTAVKTFEKFGFHRGLTQVGAGGLRWTIWLRERQAA